MENIILPEGYESNDNDNTNLVNELEKSTNVAYTENSAISNRSSLDAVLDFFASGGAMRYNTESEIFDLFHKAFVQDNLLALKCLFTFVIFVVVKVNEKYFVRFLNNSEIFIQKRLFAILIML